MAEANLDLYLALVEAGASEERARLAAQDATSIETRLGALDARLTVFDGRLTMLETLLSHSRLEMRTWMGLVVAIALGILWKVW